MRISIIAIPLSLLVGLSSVSAQTAPQLGNQLTRAEQKKLQPGIMVVVYPKHETQLGNEGGFVEVAAMGEPVKAPGNPFVLNQLQDWKYPQDFNAVASGLLRIDKAGEYRFLAKNFYDRNTLSINGQMVCPYRDGDDMIVTVKLEKGFVPITCVGYVNARGSVQVTWQPPGAQAMQPIPAEIMFFMPPSNKKKK